MSYDSTQDFLIDLESLPALSSGERGEWIHTVTSGWIDGVFFNDRQDPNCTVGLQRAANNEDGFDDVVLDYEVTVQFGPNRRHISVLSMTPLAAITLGHHLIAAGTTGMRDFASNASFVAGDLTPDRKEPGACR
jgi:hypothetical protein